MRINGLDEKNNLILELLRQNARMSNTEIGEKIGLSRTAVKNRIREMEESGIIKGYSAVIDPQSSPEMMTFITIVETVPHVFDTVASLLKNEPCVVTLCQLSGECRLHAVCVAESIPAMRDFAKRMRNSTPGLKSIGAYNVWEVLKGNVLPE